MKLFKIFAKKDVEKETPVKKINTYETDEDEYVVDTFNANQFEMTTELSQRKMVEELRRKYYK